MFEVFQKYVSDKVSFTEDELQQMQSTSENRHVYKGEHILREGEVWKYRAFITKGLLRTYRTDEKGMEHSIRFAMEEWWVGDGESYMSGKPSIYHIDALEDTHIILWKKEDFDQLMTQIPAVRELRELLIFRNLMASQNRIFDSNSLSSEDKYRLFLESFPQFSQRIPLHMIASYLGVTRETLTRARRKIADR